MHQIELLGIHFINHWCGEFFRIFFFITEPLSLNDLLVVGLYVKQLVACMYMNTGWKCV